MGHKRQQLNKGYNNVKLSSFNYDCLVFKNICLNFVLCFKSVVLLLRTTCEIPYAEGYIYSYNDSNQYSILFSGTRVDLYRVVDESCEKEYYKNGPDKSIICSANGQWKPLPSNNLCLSKYTIVV